MSTSSLSEMPAGLEASFSRLTTRLFMLTLFRGLGRWLTGMVIMLSVLLISDWMFDWSAEVRGVLIWSLPVVGLGLFWMYLVRPLSFSLSATEKAALIDLHYPDLRERLTSTVEFCDPDLPEEYKGSAVMRDLVVSETISRLPKLDAAKSLPADRMQKALLWGVMAVAFLLLPFVIRPGHYQLLWSRLLSPAGNYATASNLFFEIVNAERIVARGTSVEFTAIPQWRLYETDLPESVWINRVDSEGWIDRSRMDWVEEVGLYQFTLPAVLQDFDYFLSADSAQTREYHIQVEDAPEIAAVTLEVEPPAYTGRPVETFSTISGRLAVFERSHLTMNLQFTKPVESVNFQWHETAISIDQEAAIGELIPLSQPTVRFSKDRTSAVVEFIAEVNGSYDLTLTDEFSLHNLEDAPHSLSIIRDQSPELHLISALDERLEARSSDNVKVLVEASDDIAIGELEMHLKLPNDREEIVYATVDSLGVPIVNHQFAVDLSPFGLQEGDRITWRIKAADERPVPESNVVWTSPRILSISEEAAPLARADVEQRQDRWKQQLHNIREQLEANSGLVKELEKDARDSQEQKKPFERSKEVPSLADQQWDLSGRLETMSLELSNHQLYREMTEVLQQISREDLSPLAEELKTFPDQEASQQPDQLRDNSQGVKQVADNLKQLEGVLETLAEIEKDLLELERLGDDTEKLADSAVALDQAQKELSEELAANPDLKENSEFLEKSDQVEQNYDALAEDQQKLTDALQNLLEKRPELVDAARKMEIDRLKKLAQDARDLAKPQEELAKQLEQEAEQLANESGEERGEQEKVLRDEQQLLAEADRQSNQAAVPPLDRSDQLQADRDFQAGNLSEAAEAQQEFAGELNRLANDLQKNQALSANPKQAVEQLAQREQELANEIKQSKDNAATTPEEAAKRDREMAKTQEAIAQALEKLQVPKEQQQQQNQASSAAKEAGENLQSVKSDQAQQKAQQAADQLKQLAQQLPDDLPTQDFAKPTSNPESVAREAQRLSKELEKVQRETERFAANPPQINPDQQRQQLQQKQQKIAQQVENLPKDIGRFPQQEAEQSLKLADQQLKENQVQQAAANQQQAKKSLDEIAKKAQEMANAAKKPSEAMTAEQVADQLRQLAAKQQQLAQQSQEAAEQESGTPESQTESQQQVAKLQERQNQLAEKSAKIALESVRNEGPEAESSKQAIQAARESDRAAQQLEAGLLQQAAQAGEKSAAASEKFAESTSEQPQGEQLAAEAKDLATQQETLSQELKELAQSPTSRQAAQQQAQQRMAAEAQKLSEKFDLSAEKLQSDPFQLRQESDQAQAAGQSSSQASQQMQQAEKNQQSANPGQASQQSRQAAQNLKAAASSVDPQAIAESPVPQEVGEQVADAFQNLKKAQEMMQQAGQSQAGQSTPPPTPDASQQSQAQQKSSQGDQPGQSDGSNQSPQKPDGMQPSPLQQTAQQLKQAAQQLQQAANQLQPNASPEGEQQGDPDSQPSTEGAASQQQIAKPGASTDLERIETELQRLKKRNWGQLPGKLQTEIMQSRQKNPNGEYGPLIKRYFESIAREQSAVQKTLTPQPQDN